MSPSERFTINNNNKLYKVHLKTKGMSNYVFLFYLNVTKQYHANSIIIYTMSI